MKKTKAILPCYLSMRINMPPPFPHYTSSPTLPSETLASGRKREGEQTCDCKRMEDGRGGRAGPTGRTRVW